ncbi:MAG TPA: glycosyl hydrolase family 18 protein [Dehalococcoidia bacterium]|nr:glycosyl hydrolase family 18 protein [Dehalococcoidia bacterium]
MRRFPPRDFPPERRPRRELPRPEGPFDRLLRRRPERDPAPFIIGGTVVFLALLILLVFGASALLGGGGGGGGGAVEGLPSGIEAKRAQLPALPPGLVAVSDFVEWHTEGDVSALIGLQLSEAQKEAAGLGFYTFLDGRWQKIADVELVEGGKRAQADLSPVPANTAVLRVVAQPYQVAGSLPAGAKLHPDAKVNVLSPRDYTPAADGSVQGTATEVQPAEGTLLMPTIVGSGEDTAAVVDDILADETLRQQHIDAIARLVSEAGFAGIDLEYSRVDAGLGSALTAFVQGLADRLHQDGKRLSLTLPPPTGQRQAYDWKKLGEAADIVKVLPIEDPVDYWEMMPDALSQVVKDVDPRKVMLVISPFSVERVGQSTRPIGYLEAMALATETAVREPQDPAQIKPGVTVKLVAANLDQGEGASTLRWSDEAAAVTFAFGGVQSRTVFLENGFSAAFKLELVQAYGLGGVAVSDASGRSDVANLWPAVKQLVDTATVSLVRPNDDGLVPRWEADGGDLNAAAGTSATWVAPNEGKTYTITLIVSDGEKRFGHKTAVEVKAGPRPTLTPIVTFSAETPTPTPTPAGTSTPTPTPSAGALKVQVGKRADANNDGVFNDIEQASPGATVVYRIVIDNDSAVPVKIDSLDDDTYMSAVCKYTEGKDVIGQTLGADDGNDGNETSETGPDAMVCKFTVTAGPDAFVKDKVTVVVKAGTDTASDFDTACIWKNNESLCAP